MVKKRWMWAPLLGLYWVALVLSSLPSEVSPDAIRPAKRLARRLFDTLHVRSASFVFAGRRGRWKRGQFDLRVLGETASGELEGVYRYRKGHQDDLRIVQKLEQPLVFKSLHFDRINTIIMEPNIDRVPEKLHRARYTREAVRMATFFCHSSHAGNGRFENIYIGITWTALDYKTGGSVRQTAMLRTMHCPSGREVPGWRRVEVGTGAQGAPTFTMPDGRAFPKRRPAPPAAP